MQTVSIIIPFFQDKPGILTRALRSIQSQHIPANWAVEVLIVDDASPCPAHDEAQVMHWRQPLRLRVVRQENGGVAAARNRGLEEVDPSTTLIAFLDSDDIWPADHLARAIQAHEAGFDFYFADNRRQGFHESHVRSLCGPETGRFIAAAQQKSGILAIPTDAMVGLVVQEFPTQASTTVYKFSIAQDLRFNTDLRAAGEDILFFTELTSKAQKIGLDLDSIVDCGGGLNIYFGNLNWDSPKCLAIRVDQLIAHRLIDKIPNLPPEGKKHNHAKVKLYRKELAYQVLRNLVKFPARVPNQLARLTRLAPEAALLLPVDIICVALAFGRYGGKKEEQAA